MVSQHVIDIIIKAQDQASAAMKNIDTAMKNLGNNSTNSINKASEAYSEYQEKIQKSSNIFTKVQNDLKKIGTTGASSFNQLSTSQQKALLDLANLDKTSRETAQTLDKVGITGMNSFLQLSNSSQKALTNMDSLSQSMNKGITNLSQFGVNATAVQQKLETMKLDPSLNTNLEQAIVKVSAMGVDIDSTKGKVLILGNEIQSSLANKWDTITNKVGITSSAIKNKIGSALTTVKSKIDTVSNAFSGLGGVISSAVGAVGVSSVSQLTIGLAMTREQMTNLTTATLGSSSAAKDFVSYMDQLTNNSLVSLNDLGQAMNTIKMSTGMTNDQLKSFTTTVNDVGQRAILMGKDSTEAMTIMQAAGRGLNGEFDILQTNFGITKDKLKDLGWSGAASDVAGYQEALNKALEAGGDMDGMMNTTTGLLKQVEKGFTSAGRKIGEMFIPYIREGLKWMVQMKSACPELYSGLILAAGGISGFATIAPTLAPILTAFDSLVPKVGGAARWLGILKTEGKAAGITMNMLSVAEALGATKLSDTAKEAMGAADAFKIMSKAMLISPVVWIAVALIAIAVAAYEVGKSFGWWSNVSEMLQAVSAGVQRLWQAFINNPNVRGFISDVIGFLKDLGGTVLWVIGIATGLWTTVTPAEGDGSVDVIRQIIDVFGQLAKIMGDCVNAIKPFWFILEPLLQLFIAFKVVSVIFTGVQTAVIGVKNKIKELKDAVKTAKDVFTSLSEKLRNLPGDKIDSLKQKIESLRTKVSEAKTKISELISKLKEISGSKIDTVKQKLSDLISKLSDAKGKVIEFARKIKDITADKISKLKDAFTKLAESIDLAALKSKLYAAAQWLVNAATAVWNALLALNPIVLIVMAIAALVAILIYLYYNNQQVHDAMNAFFIMLQGFASWLWDGLIGAWNAVCGALQWVYDLIVGGLIGAWTWFWQTLQGIGEFLYNLPGQILSAFLGFIGWLVTLPQQVWTWLLATLTAIGQWILSLWNSAVQAGSSFVMGIITWFMQLPGRIWTFLWSVINRVISWAGSMVAQARSAGSRFVTGVISFIMSLPGRIWSYLSNIIGKVVSWASSMISHARSAGSGMVTGLISYVSQLPGKVFNEFIKIKDKILQAGAQIIAKARSIGSDIVKAMLNAMGIHSPGFIQLAVDNEMQNTVDKIDKMVKPAGDAAKKLGSTITDKFGTPTLSTDTTDLIPNTDSVTTDANVTANTTVTDPSMSVPVTTDTSALQSGLGGVNDMTNTANQGITDSYNLLATNMGTAMDQMVLKDQLSYGTIQANDTTTMNTVKTTLANSLNSMNTNLTGQLNNMVNKNKTSLTSVKNTTQSQLNSMYNTTKETTTKMTTAWNGMASSIIAAAGKIKTEATSYFDKLSSTIGKFYHHLQNPSTWSAGPASGTPSRVHPIGHSGAGFSSKISNMLRKNNSPSYVTYSQAERNPLIKNNSFDYLNANKNNKVSLKDLIRGNLLTIPVGLENPDSTSGAGWMDSVSNNVSYIKNKARNWKMKGPDIAGKYQTGTNFLVSQFENGAPDIDFSTFKAMAEDVFSQCHYEFYWDSERYGSWLSAFMNGGMNCSDSSDALIGLARACGLSASKVHGHWNSLGHFWANVAGNKMDTTGYMLHRNWTPSQSHAGPAPSGFNVFDEQSDLLKNIENNTENTDKTTSTVTSNEPVQVDINLKLEHDFNLENIPEGMQEEDIVNALKEVVTDENWIKKLVNNHIFQDADAKVKNIIQARNMRGAGI